MDKERIRKRPRLAWDVGPSESEAQRALVVDGNQWTEKHVTPPRRDDDREGHFVFSLGDNLTPRYKILSKMGEGTFGRVLECWDRKTREFVAIKVIRSIRKYRDAAMIEIDVLHRLARNDKSCSRCVQIQNWFDYRDHICITKNDRPTNIPHDELWVLIILLEVMSCLPWTLFMSLWTKQIPSFLDAISLVLPDMHDLQMIHTDLKPENVLLVSSDHVKLPTSKRGSSDQTRFRWLPKSSAIKLIDFGSTAFDNQNHSSIVSTRHYRAPEVVLGLGWSYPCDIWSVGCILVELCTGEALFQMHENLEHLAMMERVLGPLPKHLICKADQGAEKYFRRRSRLNWPEGAVSRESIRAVKKLDSLEEMVYRHVDSSRSLLVDLLHGLLKYDPSERLTARNALNHPFFRIPS
ncbi:Serine/threonine-protein kinase AFC3 [Linum perenne]